MRHSLRFCKHYIYYALPTSWQSKALYQCLVLLISSQIRNFLVCLYDFHVWNCLLLFLVLFLVYFLLPENPPENPSGMNMQLVYYYFSENWYTCQTFYISGNLFGKIWPFPTSQPRLNVIIMRILQKNHKNNYYVFPIITTRDAYPLIIFPAYRKTGLPC